MISIQSRVEVSGAAGAELIDFMLTCSDETYQAWWPGTHLAFHTTQRFPHDLGNRVYFDEYVGKRRLRFKAVISAITPGRKIVWQMVKGFKLPVWLTLQATDKRDGVLVTHTVSAGFSGIGRLLDPLVRLYFSEEFVAELHRHANTEFHKLAELLAARKQASNPPAHSIQPPNNQQITEKVNR